MKPFPRITLLCVVGLGALVGCSGVGEATEPATSEPRSGESPSLVVPSGKPSINPGSGSGSIAGVLGFDDIEGGCAYLESSNGTRYEVIYPDGWQLVRSPLQLVSPDGHVVARAGDEVAVRGALATDMSSICQIGPIFRATAVEAP